MSSADELEKECLEMVLHLDASGQGKPAFKALQRCHAQISPHLVQQRKLLGRAVTMADFDEKVHGIKGRWRECTAEAFAAAEAHEDATAPLVLDAWRRLHDELSALGREAA